MNKPLAKFHLKIQKCFHKIRLCVSRKLIYCQLLLRQRRFTYQLQLIMHFSYKHLFRYYNSIYHILKAILNARSTNSECSVSDRFDTTNTKAGHKDEQHKFIFILKRLNYAPLTIFAFPDVPANKEWHRQIPLEKYFLGLGFKSSKICARPQKCAKSIAYKNENLEMIRLRTGDAPSFADQESKRNIKLYSAEVRQKRYRTAPPSTSKNFDLE